MGHRMQRFGGGDDDFERSVPDMVLFKRMIGYITSQRREFTLLVLGIIASTIINLLPPYMYSLAIDAYIKQLDTRGLYLLGIGFVVVYLLTFGTQYVRQYLINWLGSKVASSIFCASGYSLYTSGLDSQTKRCPGILPSSYFVSC